MMPAFSVIVPVYNRPDEVRALLHSLSLQTMHDFEVVVVEDGSEFPCREVVDAYRGVLNIHYFSKPNTGQSDSRNFGMRMASSEYFVLFDSDCEVPPLYFENLQQYLKNHPLDCFGGADDALPDFSVFQKAVNYVMTSFFTTGGIRGSRHAMEAFNPRSFNMGFSRKVFALTGGFSEMHVGEDIDLSLRIRESGFSVGYVPGAFVYHRRKTHLKAFARQVFRFGKARVSLARKHKGSLKWVHVLPAFFIPGMAVLLCLSLVCSPLWLLLPGLYFVILWLDAWRVSGNLRVALLVVPISMIQLGGYGSGFSLAWLQKSVSPSGTGNIMYKI